MQTKNTYLSFNYSDNFLLNFKGSLSMRMKTNQNRKKLKKRGKVKGKLWVEEETEIDI